MPITTILQIIPHLDTGGAEQSTVEITEAVVKGGGRALVLSEGGRLETRLAGVGGELIRFSAATKNPARMLWNAKRIADLIQREGVNVIHARSRAPAWSALAASRRCSIPFVTTYHGAYSEKTRIKNFYNGVMARSDIVIANSQYTANLIKCRYGTDDARVRVIYRGVDGVRFDPASISAARITALREAWGVTPGQRIVLHAARVSPIKGQRVVIDAARRLQADGRLGNTAVILAGSAQGRDGYVEELNATIRNAGLDAIVRLTGHLDDMPAGLAAAHVALMVSTEPEGFGRVAAEAQAIGCPVIVTRIGALPETVLSTPDVAADQITGWVVTPNDAEELAGAIANGLTLAPSERAAMAQRARARVLNLFAASQMQSQTLAVYDQLLGTSLKAAFETHNG